MGAYNNQPIFGFDVRECIGEEARPGRNVWGGRLPVVWCDELIDKKERGGGCVSLRWPPFDGGTQQSTIIWRLRWEGHWGGEADGAEHVGWTPCHFLAVKLIDDNN